MNSMTKFYGETKHEQDAGDMTACRQIVSEIMNFGVKQSQIISVVKLLALELENREHMLMICDCVEKINDGDLATTTTNLIKN